MVRNAGKFRSCLIGLNKACLTSTVPHAVTDDPDLDSLKPLGNSTRVHDTFGGA